MKPYEGGQPATVSLLALQPSSNIRHTLVYYVLITMFLSVCTTRANVHTMHIFWAQMNNGRERYGKNIMCLDCDSSVEYSD